MISCDIGDRPGFRVAVMHFTLEKQNFWSERNSQADVLDEPWASPERRCGARPSCGLHPPGTSGPAAASGAASAESREVAFVV